MFSKTSEICHKMLSRITISRISHLRCSVKKVVLKIFGNFAGKRLCWSLFLMKLQGWWPAILLKRDSNTGVFLWNLRNSSEHLLRRTPANGCSWISVANCQNTFLRFLTWSVFKWILLLRDLPVGMTGTYIFVSASNSNDNNNKNRN